MSDNTGIPWCDATINPVVGCSRVPISTGCDRCFAQRFAHRLSKQMWPQWATDIRDQCKEAGVPFFFKGFGATLPKPHRHLLEGKTYHEFPEVK